MCDRGLLILVVLAILVGILGSSLPVQATSVAVDPEDWLQRAKLLAPDGAGGDWFGWPVEVSGDTAVVGTPYADARGNDSGAVYVFVNKKGTWTYQAKLTPPGRGDKPDYRFGSGVAIEGDTLVVGAPGADANRGIVFVYARSGNIWTPVATLTGKDSAYGDCFGHSVGFGKSIIVSAPHDDSSRGAAYVFAQVGGAWVQQAKLVAKDGASGDRFSHRAVAIDGDIALTGAERDTHSGVGFAGSAYVFVQGKEGWTQQAKLVAGDVSQSKHFGISVALSGDTALVGCFGCRSPGTDAGAAYVYQRTGTNWPEQARLVPADNASEDRFGNSVSLDGDTAVIGAMNDDDGGADAGSAYLYTRAGTAWTEGQKLLAADGEGGDYFGRYVAFDGTTIAVGAPLDDDQGTDAGSAYIFAINTPPIVAAYNDPITVDEAAAAGNSGYFNDADGDDVVVTASVGSITQDPGYHGHWHWTHSEDDGPGGSQTVTLVATDSLGAQGTTAFDLVVINVAPQADFENDGPVDEGSPATITFENESDPSSQDQGAGFHFSYDLDNDGAWDIGNGKYGSSVSQRSAEVAASYLDDGPSTHTVKGRILDKDGGLNDYTTGIQVLNVAPDVSIDQITDDAGQELGVDMDVVLLGLTVYLEGSFTDPGVLDTHTAGVDWGDGSPGQDLGAVTGDLEAGHAYTAAGAFTIQLSVEDKDGGVGSATAGITVVDPAGAAGDSIDDLEELLPDVNKDAAAAIQEAIDGLDGGDGGQADNGVLDKLEAGDTGAALNKLRDVLEDLEKAEVVGSLDLSTFKAQLALIAKAAAVEAISQAEAVASSPGELRQVARANELLGEGNDCLAAGDYSGAVDKYRAAWQKAMAVLG